VIWFYHVNRCHREMFLYHDHTPVISCITWNVFRNRMSKQPESSIAYYCWGEYGIPRFICRLRRNQRFKWFERNTCLKSKEKKEDKMMHISVWKTFSLTLVLLWFWIIYLLDWLGWRRRCLEAYELIRPENYSALCKSGIIALAVWL
jgi:prolipoprotein diacylglyceryltransferase